MDSKQMNRQNAEINNLEQMLQVYIRENRMLWGFGILMVLFNIILWLI